jgi:hypothetical protein
MSDIKEVLRKMDVRFAESGGHHHARPGWIQLETCPFCGSRNYHLGVNLGGLFANCWKCGSHHIGKLLAELGAPRRLAKELLDERALYNPAFKPKERKGLIEPKLRGPLQEAHRRYLEEVRGFDSEALEKLWSIQGIGIAPRLQWRIYIPITLDNQKVSWTTRAITDKEDVQRYVSASAEEEAVNHRDVVYGLDYCLHSTVICEGPFDAWAIGPGGVCLFGIDFSMAQIRRLARVPYRFVCFDSAPDAQRKALELCRQLSVFPGETHNILLDAKDPAKASAKELETLRKVAKL